MAHGVHISIGKDKYTTEIKINEHQIIADEPTDLGGQDLGPSPTELLLSALGTCKAMTMRMYADQKHWPLDKVEIELTSETEKSQQGQTTYIHCTIKLVGTLDEMQRERIAKIADRCPIQRILSNPIVVESNFT